MCIRDRYWRSWTEVTYSCYLTWIHRRDSSKDWASSCCQCTEITAKKQCYTISALCVFRCLAPLPRIRVWKGIFGIRDLAKIWWMWENAKIFTGNGIWLREGGLTKIWSHDVGYFVCLLGIPIDMFSLFLSSFFPPSCPTEVWKAMSFLQWQ